MAHTAPLKKPSRTLQVVCAYWLTDSAGACARALGHHNGNIGASSHATARVAKASLSSAAERGIGPLEGSSARSLSSSHFECPAEPGFPVESGPHPTPNSRDQRHLSFLRPQVFTSRGGQKEGRSSCKNRLFHLQKSHDSLIRTSTVQGVCTNRSNPDCSAYGKGEPQFRFPALLLQTCPLAGRRFPYSGEYCTARFRHNVQVVRNATR